MTWYSVEDILQVLIVFVVESLELDFALLFPERHILLRVLPVLVVLVTSSEKDSESLYKRVKINRLINIFKVPLFICLLINVLVNRITLLFDYLKISTFNALNSFSIANKFKFVYHFNLFYRMRQSFLHFQICICLLLQY